MAYQYDVFLSYNTKYPHGAWVNEVFLPFFKPYLEDALNIKNVSIFQDVSEIKSGQDWEEKILSALLHSRIMVSVLSPAYFNSEWCKKEFAVMDYRQRQLGYMTLDKPSGIIVPVKISDGEYFPKAAKAIQIKDLNKYHRTGPGFPHTPLFVDLQGELQKWVDDVALAHRSAPEFDTCWTDNEWLEKSYSHAETLQYTRALNPPVL